jgi:hypothetical protein
VARTAEVTLVDPHLQEIEPSLVLAREQVETAVELAE